jgi:hypothetical protein
VSQNVVDMYLFLIRFLIELRLLYPFNRGLAGYDYIRVSEHWGS